MKKEEIDKISIIVPCRNEVEYIEGFIESIMAQENVNASIEIIVVDGLSSDGTREKLINLKNKYNNITILTNINKTIPYALNMGVIKSKGQVIARLDVHSKYPKTYIANGIETLLRSDADIVGGRCINIVKKDKLIAKSIAAITSNWFGVGNSPFRIRKKPGYVDSVVFGFFWRYVFDICGLWDIRLTRNQDTEFWARAKKKGLKIYFNPNIIVYYYNRQNFKSFMYQAWWTGLWNFITLLLFRNTIKIRHLVPATFSLYCIMVPLFYFFFGMILSPSVFNLILIPLIIYFSILLFASFEMAPKKDPIKINLYLYLCCVAITPCYHFVYGIGILSGLLILLAGRINNYVKQ